MANELKTQFDRDGFSVVKGLLSPRECDRMVQHMMDLHSGKISMEGFAPRPDGNFNRTHNQHLWDPMAMELLLHPRLKEPLTAAMGEEPEAVQTMYFWKGSE